MTEGLENQAKTIYELTQKRKEWLEDFSNGALGNQVSYEKARENRALYEQGVKYVPLGVAQKEITDRDILIKKLQGKLETEPNALASQLVRMTNNAIEAKTKVEAANKILTEILNGLTDKMPIAKKITQYDPETKEDWTIEVPDQYEYSTFFDWVDGNLKQWRGVLEIPRKEEAETI